MSLVDRPWADTGGLGSGVPKGFKSESMSWTSADHGYVAGWVPCEGDGRYPSCLTILSTSDGGQSWSDFPAPDITAGDGNERGLQLTAAEGASGTTVLLDYQSAVPYAVRDLWVTYDGGQTWQEKLDDKLADDDLAQPGRATATSEYVYATVGPDYGGGGTDMYRSVPGEDTWELAPELDVPVYAVTVDLEARGSTAVLAVDKDSNDDNSGSMLWITRNGADWVNRGDPCAKQDDLEQVAVGTDRLFAYCMARLGDNYFMVSYDDGRTFEPSGPVKFDDFLTDIDGADDTMLWSAGNYDCSARMSSDDGASWRTAWEIVNPPTLGAEEVAMPDADTGYVLCTGVELWARPATSSRPPTAAGPGRTSDSTTAPNRTMGR